MSRKLLLCGGGPFEVCQWTLKFHSFSSKTFEIQISKKKWDYTLTRIWCVNFPFCSSLLHYLMKFFMFLYMDLLVVQRPEMTHLLSWQVKTSMVYRQKFSSVTKKKFLDSLFTRLGDQWSFAKMKARVLAQEQLFFSNFLRNWEPSTHMHSRQKL